MCRRPMSSDTTRREFCTSLSWFSLTGACAVVGAIGSYCGCCCLFFGLIVGGGITFADGFAAMEAAEGFGSRVGNASSSGGREEMFRRRVPIDASLSFLRLYNGALSVIFTISRQKSSHQEVGSYLRASPSSFNASSKGKVCRTEWAELGYIDREHASVQTQIFMKVTRAI